MQTIDPKPVDSSLGEPIGVRKSVLHRIWGYFSPCRPPCHLYLELLKEGEGSPATSWHVDATGYPFVNVVIVLRGDPNQHYGVQLRHFHSPSSAPAATFTFEFSEGALGPAGFELLQYDGIRLLMPQFQILVYSNDGNFDVIAATVYATVA